MREHTGRHHLTTLFDEDIPALMVPGVIASGRHPALLVHDGITLGNKHVGRFQRSIGMVGVKTRLPGDAASVEVELKADPSSRKWLPERHADTGKTLPRLLLIRVQGRLRNALILGPRVRSSAHAHFRMTADELPDGELLVFEALSVQLGEIPFPRPLRDSVAPWGPAGVKIKRLHMHDAAEPARTAFINRPKAERIGLISAGGHTSRTGVNSPLSRGLFTINPHPALGAQNVRMRFQPARQWRLPAMGLVQPPSLETIDLATGNREPLPLERTRGGCFEALLPGPVTSPRLGVIGTGDHGSRTSYLLRGVEVSAP